MEDWSQIGELQLHSKPGFDLTKVLFADFNRQVAERD